MTSELCRHIHCPFYGKFSGKAVCLAQQPKRFIKHMGECPQTIRQ